MQIFYYHYYSATTLLKFWNMFRCFKHNHHQAINGRLYKRVRIICLDELSSVVRLERRTTDDSSSWTDNASCDVFMLETYNQTNNERLSKFVLTDNVSSSIKTAKMIVNFGSFSKSNY